MDNVKVTEDSSRTEKILGTMTGDYSGSIDRPESRVEALLLKLSKKIADGSSAGGIKSIKTVDKLPETGEVGVIYSVKKVTPEEGDQFDEFYWTGTSFDHLGSTNIDLTKFTDTNTTYTLTQDATNKRILYFTASDGTKTEIELPKDEADYKVKYNEADEMLSFDLATDEDPQTIGDKLGLSKVATTGSYNDLEDKPSVRQYSLAQGIRDNSNLIFTEIVDGKEYTHKISLAKVAGSGSFNDLKDVPEAVLNTTKEAEEKESAVKYFPQFSKVSALPTVGDANTVYEIYDEENKVYSVYRWNESTNTYDDYGVTEIDYTQYSRYTAGILFVVSRRTK